MIEADDKRLNDLETIVWDFPSLINSRFERFDAETDANRLALADNTARLVQVERRLNVLTTDMRDMRAGITRHMLEQARQMTAMVAKIDALDGRMGRLDGRMGGLEERMGGLEDRMDKMEGRMGTLEGLVERGVDKLDGKMSKVETVLQQIMKRLPN